MSTMMMRRLIRNGAQTYSRGAQSYSKTDANTVEIRVVFENGAVAATLFTIFSSPNQANSCISKLADMKSDSEINKSMVHGLVQKDWITCNLYTCTHEPGFLFPGIKNHFPGGPT